MVRDIDNTQDVMDSRDIIKRLEELESNRESLVEAVNDAAEALKEANEEAAAAESDGETYIDARDILLENLENANTALAEWNDADEYKALKDFAEEAEGYSSDWIHGATLIRESYFVEYCQQLVEDIGDLPKGVPSYIAIDWEETADNLKADYSTVSFDGVDYLVRD